MEKELERLRNPVLKKADKRLDELLNKGLFQKKVDEANETLKKYGLPKFDKE